MRRLAFLFAVAVGLIAAADCHRAHGHRLTGGVGCQGFLIPNLDLDIFAGGLFKAEDDFGPTQASVAVYYIGLGLTWRYGNGSGQLN